MELQKTSCYSWKIGNLPKGCQLCVKGLKSVLFITGLCPKHCFYCPISDKKYGKDVVYINEWPTKKIKDIIKEIELCSSKGVGITGGDPLVKIKRAVSFIKILKRRFGKRFHIHLYTPLNLVNSANLKRLYNSGLDEIRLHPNISNSDEWKKIELARKYKWKVGVEIPAIPGKEDETINLINFLNGKVNFLNINELEYSDTNASHLEKFNLKTKDTSSYGIKGSEELAFLLLDYIKNKKLGFDVHYCTATLKDKVQLAKRIIRRAKNVRKAYDIVNKEGMLIRGAIYLKELTPSFHYRKKLERANKDNALRKLNHYKKIIIKNFNLKDSLIDVDENKLRMLTSVKMIRKLKDKIKAIRLIPAIVEEYPTYDQIEMSVEFL